MRTIAIRLGGVGGVIMVASALLSLGPAFAMSPAPRDTSPQGTPGASPVQTTGPAQRPAHDAADINDCKSEDPERVIAACTRLMATDLSDRERAIALSNRGAAYDRTGKREQAMADLDTAIRLDPTSAIAHFNRGLTQDKLGRHEAAIADLAEANRSSRTGRGPSSSEASSSFIAAERAAVHSPNGSRGRSPISTRRCVLRLRLQESSPTASLAEFS